MREDFKNYNKENQHSKQSYNVKGTITKDEYQERVKAALDYISIGDIYQVQLGHQLELESDIKPFEVYNRLRTKNPSPYMYLATFDDLTLIGASPELFVKVEKGKIIMRPIAGTAKRGRNAEEDSKLVLELSNNEKEIAEHIMLVDLCRNDIGRVTNPGKLKVDELLSVEQYSHVNHLVSEVVGEKSDKYDVYDIIAATFPAGTMTGAPKIRAMEIIEELETSRRGVYAGAIGLIDFTGYVNTALCIRTTVYSKGKYYIRASGGVVADSTPLWEWNETLHKMGATYWAITGEEIEYESIGN